MKKTKSMAKDIESAKMGGFKEAEKTYKKEIDRLKKIELNLDDEVKRMRAELNKEHVKRLAELEREKKQSETKYIAEIAQLRASLQLPTIVAAATREEEKTVSSPNRQRLMYLYHQNVAVMMATTLIRLRKRKWKKWLNT